jgi:hypothetical protein
VTKRDVVVTGVALLAAVSLAWEGAGQAPEPFGGNIVIGRPTDRSVTISVLATRALEGFVEYGVRTAGYTGRTDLVTLDAGRPLEITLERLQPNTLYDYRLRYRQPGESSFSSGAEATFQTARAPGSTFTFGVQGDSHPERLNRMYDPDLYVRTMQNAAASKPDFYLTMGDDFSVDPLISRGQLTQQGVDQVYENQRRFLALVGRSAALFLVNGNHEEAARYLLNGSAASPAVMAGRARTRFLPLPAPDAFYSGDAEAVEGVGFLRDYYAWTWGDALFAVVDCYWHSPVRVDALAGGSGGNRGGAASGAERRQNRGAGRAQEGGGAARDWWGITIGDAQYQWLKTTLEQSKARFKFIFAHHVLGTGRGGVEMSDLYEWGGKDPSGEPKFAAHRPKWEMPIHQLMVKTGVTAFFQGHDHLFARQERDGIIYQGVPNPADGTYQAFNQDAYRSGDILPNSGFLRVTVGPSLVAVEYVRTWLPRDEQGGRKNSEVASSYTVKARAALR